MMREICKSKIHRATVTEGDLNYVGSITIDEELMEKADIIENEKVLIVNISNGHRWETYATPGKRGSGIVCVNGGGARLCLKGDIVTILSFGHYTPGEMKNYKPCFIHVDEHNKVNDHIG